LRQQAGEVDEAEDLAGSGIDAGDAVGVPDIGVDIAVNELEFIELVDGMAMVGYSYAAEDFEC